MTMPLICPWFSPSRYCPIVYLPMFPVRTTWALTGRLRGALPLSWGVCFAAVALSVVAVALFLASVCLTIPRLLSTCADVVARECLDGAKAA